MSGDTKERKRRLCKQRRLLSHDALSVTEPRYSDAVKELETGISEIHTQEVSKGRSAGRSTGSTYESTGSSYESSGSSYQLQLSVGDDCVFDDRFTDAQSDANNNHEVEFFHLSKQSTESSTTIGNKA